MTRIVELCSAAHEFEANALCAALGDAGIPARVVGATLANAVWLGPMAELVTPRIWVDEADVPRAREILDEFRSQTDGELSDDLSCDPPDAEEVLPQEEFLKTSRTVTRLGIWLLGGAGCAWCGSTFCITLLASIQAIRPAKPIRALIEPVSVMVVSGVLTLLVVHFLRKSLRDHNRTEPPEEHDAMAPNDVAQRDTFRFAPELFEVRNTVIAELRRRGFEWLTHYSAVDVMHDVYGIEVCGIHEEDDASGILDVLRRMFPSWKRWRTYYKDCGRDPGFMVTIQRDREPPDQPWQTAQ